MPSATAPFVLTLPVAPGRSVAIVVHDGGAFVPPGTRSLRWFAPRAGGGWIAGARNAHGRWGFVDEKGTWLVEPAFDDARAYADDGLARVARDGLWGFVDTDGRVVVEPRYPETRVYRHGLVAVREGDDAWRFLDVRGEPAFEGVFAGVRDFGPDGLAAAARSRRENRGGYLDRDGRWAIEPRFRSDRTFAGGVAPASEDGHRWGLVDHGGRWVVEPSYADIHDFNDDGLAYFSADTPGGYGKRGYLDARGRVVLTGDAGLSKRMCRGLVAAESSGESYVRRDGRKLDAPRLSFSMGFGEYGWTPARSADFLWDPARERHESRDARWGFLHEDGRFVEAPADALEPLTNGEGWIVAPHEIGHVQPYLARDGRVLWLDGDGRTRCALSFDGGRAVLRDGSGTTLWRDDGARAVAPVPFFARPASAWLKKLAAVDGAVAHADAMLADVEARLHAFAGGAVPGTGGANADDDDDEDEDEDEDEEEDEEEGEDEEEDEDEDDDDDDGTGERHLLRTDALLHAYVSEEHNGAYPFLPSIHQRVIDGAAARIRADLVARFGPVDPDPELGVAPRHTACTVAWPVATARAIDGDPGTLPDARTLWLALVGSGDSGDGDEWHDVFLVCAPGRDALDAARRARASHTLPAIPEPAPSRGPRMPEWQTRPRPQTRAEWLAVVRKERHALPHVPPELLDDEMVDAAIDASVAALACAPPRFRTAERLDTLVRRDADTASSIPPPCMTAAALALARELWGDRRDWQWRDQQHSKTPAELDHNSLGRIWGALLTVDDVEQALRRGAGLDDVPHWLRTDRLEQFALDVHISNIRYVAKERITRALAERAVCSRYGGLLEHVPRHLVDAELCRTSVGLNGSTLEYVPLELRSVELCATALADDDRALVHVPDNLREAVMTQLLDRDLAQARRDGESRTASRWHVERAWVRLWNGDWAGALADATIGTATHYAVHAHYVTARAQLALGNMREAAIAASTVLATYDPYQAQHDMEEDTTWLATLARGRHGEPPTADALLAQVREHPRSLADVPRDRIDETLVAAALAADPKAIEWVPKRLMTPERYALAVKQRVKGFHNIPRAMLSEEACVEHVDNAAYHLAEIPPELRTLRVCATAMKHNVKRALEFVPEGLRELAASAARAMPDDD